MRISNESLLGTPAVTVVKTAGQTWTSRAIWLGHIANFSIQLKYSGATSATYKLQACCDEGLPQAQDQATKDAHLTNWTDLAAATNITNGAGTVLINVVDAPYNWVRIVVSEAITITSARVNVKGV